LSCCCGLGRSAEPLFGHNIRDRIRGGSFAVGPLEDFHERVVNSFEMGVNLVVVMVAAKIRSMGDLDDAAGIDDISGA